MSLCYQWRNYQRNFRLHFTLNRDVPSSIVSNVIRNRLLSTDSSHVSGRVEIYSDEQNHALSKNARLGTFPWINRGNEYSYDFLLYHPSHIRESSYDNFQNPQMQHGNIDKIQMDNSDIPLIEKHSLNNVKEFVMSNNVIEHKPNQKEKENHVMPCSPLNSINSIKMTTNKLDYHKLDHDFFSNPFPGTTSHHPSYTKYASLYKYQISMKKGNIFHKEPEKVDFIFFPWVHVLSSREEWREVAEILSQHGKTCAIVEWPGFTSSQKRINCSVEIDTRENSIVSCYIHFVYQVLRYFSKGREIHVITDSPIKHETKDKGIVICTAGGLAAGYVVNALRELETEFRSCVSTFFCVSPIWLQYLRRYYSKDSYQLLRKRTQLTGYILGWLNTSFRLLRLYSSSLAISVLTRNSYCSKLSNSKMMSKQLFLRRTRPYEVDVLFLLSGADKNSDEKSFIEELIGVDNNLRVTELEQVAHNDCEHLIVFPSTVEKGAHINAHYFIPSSVEEVHKDLFDKLRRAVVESNVPGSSSLHQSLFSTTRIHESHGSLMTHEEDPNFFADMLLSITDERTVSSTVNKTDNRFEMNDTKIVDRSYYADYLPELEPHPVQSSLQHIERFEEDLFNARMIHSIGEVSHTSLIDVKRSANLESNEG